MAPRNTRDIMHQRITRRLVPWPLSVFSLLLIAALCGRMWVLQQLSLQALGCRWCSVPGLLGADLPLLATLGVLFGLSYALPRRLWSLLWRGLALTGLMIYLADIVVTAQFATRLSLADLRIYLEQPALVWRQLGQQPLWQQSAAVGGTALLVALLWPRPRALSRRAVTLTLLAWVSVGLAGWMIPYSGYVHDWAVRNVLTANRVSGESTPYSSATQQRLLGNAKAAPAACKPGDASRENIVLLVLESWSPYHSQLWSGLNDWTPRLDQLAQTGVRFKRLHAGGFTTNQGLISLLTGHQFSLPITPPSQAKPFESAWHNTTTLPKQLAELGYNNHFITSGNLSFTRKGEWLNSLGFDSLEGHDHPFYQGIPRQHFDAAPDDVLYTRARQAIEELANQPPYFAMVESVSSHHPHIHPYTHEHDEEAVMRFVDAAAAAFITDLRTDGFFDNGILVVVSDHRAMTFVSEQERRLMGRAADSRIPGFILAGDSEEPKTINGLLHQADLLPTLVGRVGDKACMTQEQHDMLADDHASRCVLHTRGDYRDHIDALCHDGEGTVKIDGDDSHFIESDGLSAEQRRALLERIARRRLLSR